MRRSRRQLVAPTLIVLFACQPDLPPGLGDRVPDSEFEVVDGTGSVLEQGEQIRLSTLKGKPVILDFWATWCGPCKAQHRYLADLKARYGDRVEVLGVLYRDDGGNLASWLERNETAYPTVLEPEGRLTKTFQVNAIPRLVLLGPDRALAWDMMGSWGRDSVSIRLDEMLSRAGTSQ